MKPAHSKKYSFRLTQAESEALEKKLEIAGLAKSDFIRKAIFTAKINVSLTQEQMDLLRMLRGLSTNMNQLAHKANQNQDFLSLAVDLIKSKVEVDSIINKINTNDL